MRLEEEGVLGPLPEDDSDDADCAAASPSAGASLAVDGADVAMEASGFEARVTRRAQWRRARADRAR